jgi:hypothetical protein
MIQVSQIAHLLSSMPSGQSLISISGESGTGKTTLGLQLTGFFLTQSSPYQHQCIWIQASESFPKHRLISLYANKSQQLKYLQKNILVFPGDGHFPTYESQYQLLNTFAERIFPPNLRVIVIDNISHHLRYWLMQQEDISVRRRIVDDFYTNTLLPLIMRCQREEIYLVLIHEVSYNVKERETKPFFSQLYDRLEMLQITLTKSLETHLKTLTVAYGMDSKVHTQQVYELTRNGLILL